MEITFDPEKRRKTLEERELDFADAPKVFAEASVTLVDDRLDYGEERYLTFGKLNGRWVAIVWTPRLRGRRIISMRHVHEREIKARKRTLD